MKFTAFAHQKKSLLHASKTPFVYDCSDPGTGKTAVAIWAFEKRLKAKQVKKALVLAPKSLLRSVWANDIKKFAPALRVAVSTAGKHETAFATDADVYVTNIDAVKWLAKQKPAFFKGFDELIVDECFPAGALVDTPWGPRPIETIKVGEAVNTSSGPLPVTNTFVSESKLLVRLEIDNGTEIYCTENHPIATSDGWRKAGDCNGMLAVQLNVHQLPQPGATLLQSKVLKGSVLGERVPERNSRPGPESVRGFTGALPVEQGRTVCGDDQDQITSGASGLGAQAEGSWGQREDEQARSDGCGDAPEDLDTPTRDSHETAEGQWVPTQLQAGLREPPTEEDSGDRRRIAHVAQTLGCEEGFILGFTRVVGVSHHELGSPVNVYNLQVDGPHDYSVAGTLVHNCTAYKHSTSDRSKAVAKIAKFFKYRRAMTGTPNGNSITDVWHQVKILDDGKRLGHSFFAFRNAVCTPFQKGPNANALEWVDKDGAEDAVFGMLSDIVVRHKFEDCVDIPEQHQYTVSYQMPPQQQKAYDEMRDHAIAEVYGSVDALTVATLKGVKPKALTHVTAINAAAVATKLMQIASGAVYQGEGKYHLIDDARYELILDLAEARKHALVFFFWNHQKDLLAKVAEKRGMTFAIIDGTVPEQERSDIVTRYQRGAYDVLFAHPKSAAHGLTLTKGTATIWASPTYDLEIFKQGSRRQYRMGQTMKTENIVVVAEGTIDEKAYNSMLVKDARMTNLLDLFATL